MAKIESLTPAQEAMLPFYTEEGIKIGLALENPEGPNKDELIRLANLHRVSCGFKEATAVRFYPSPFAAIKAEQAMGNNINTSNALFGCHDIGWLQFYKFFRVECNLVAETDCVQYLIELANHAGWFWMDEDVIIFSARPTLIKTLKKEDGTIILHSADGPAMQFADGYSMFMVDGVRVS